MPYVDIIERIRMAKEKIPVPKSVGDLNFLVTLDILEDFLKEIRYHTIHNIYKKYFLTPHQGYFPKWREAVVGKTFTIEDFLAACHLAYHEFSSRVVRKYEDMCIKKNGDVDKYEEVLALIAEKEAQIKIEE
jgi:hypothetical protein